MSSSKAHFRDHGPIDCKVYVGNLGDEASRHELWDTFQYYGELRNVWVARNPSGFAFVEFVDSNDAANAVKHLDNKMVCGRRVVVELSSGESRKKYRGGGGSSRGGSYRSNERCYECGRVGHFARDCTARRGGGGRYSSRRYSRSRSRSRSRSYGRRSPSRSRSRSPRQRSPSRSRSRSASPYRSPGRSYNQD